MKKVFFEFGPSDFSLDLHHFSFFIFIPISGTQGHLHLHATGDCHLPLGEPGLLRRPHAKRNISIERRCCGQYSF